MLKYSAQVLSVCKRSREVRCRWRQAWATRSVVLSLRWQSVDPENTTGICGTTSESSVVSPLIGPTLRDSTNHGTSCFCVLETLPFSLPADIFYSTPTLLTSEVTRSCSCSLSLTIGHILMQFGRMDSRMPRKLWSQLQQDLTYSWHPLPFGCIIRISVTP
jgi:hypothetical protein